MYHLHKYGVETSVRKSEPLFSFCGDLKYASNKENIQSNNIIGNNINYSRKIPTRIQSNPFRTIIQPFRDLSTATENLRSVSSRRQQSSPKKSRDSAHLLSVYRKNNQNSRDSTVSTKSRVHLAGIQMEDRKSNKIIIEPSTITTYCQKYYSDYLRARITRSREKQNNLTRCGNRTKHKSTAIEASSNHKFDFPMLEGTNIPNKSYGIDQDDSLLSQKHSLNMASVRLSKQSYTKGTNSSKVQKPTRITNSKLTLFVYPFTQKSSPLSSSTPITTRRSTPANKSLVASLINKSFSEEVPNGNSTNKPSAIKRRDHLILTAGADIFRPSNFHQLNSPVASIDKPQDCAVYQFFSKSKKPKGSKIGDLSKRRTKNTTNKHFDTISNLHSDLKLDMPKYEKTLYQDLTSLKSIIHKESVNHILKAKCNRKAASKDIACMSSLCTSVTPSEVCSNFIQSANTYDSARHYSPTGLSSRQMLIVQNLTEVSNFLGSLKSREPPSTSLSNTQPE